MRRSAKRMELQFPFVQSDINGSSELEFWTVPERFELTTEFDRKLKKTAQGKSCIRSSLF